jgi:signal transduction histidine kinase/PAS domain-containing protein
MNLREEILSGFERISALLPVPMLLVTGSGLILACNQATRGLSTLPFETLVGRRLQELVSDGDAFVDEYLRVCSQSPSLMLGGLTWRQDDGTVVTSRCEGTAIAANNGDEGMIMLRVQARGSETAYFQTLNRRIDMLSEELGERRRAEEALLESQERFHRAQQAGRLGTWDWDIESGRLIWDGVEAVHGREPGSFEGSFEAYVRDIHHEDRGGVLGAIEEARASGGELHIDYRIVWPDGSIHWVAGRGRSFRDQHGHVSRMSGTCQDITDHKRAEGALEFLASASEVLSSSLRYEETLESLARLLVPYLADWCAIYVKSDGGIERVAVSHVNPDKAELAGRYRDSFPVDPDAPFGPGQVIRSGTPSFMFHGPPPLQQAGPPEQREALLELGMRSIIIVPLLARDRTIGAISLGQGESGRTYSEEDVRLAEEVGRRAGLAVDNAILFEESQRSQAELRRSNEAKDEFLGILAHEIRSPTTTLYGTARIMRSRWKDLDDDTIGELLEGMEDQSERLNRLIQNLLMIARVELGREIPLEETDVTMLVEKTVADYVRRRPSRGVSTDLRLLPPAMLVPTYVEQVLRNLLENADKYSPPDQALAVTLRAEGEGFTLRVLDRGPGISPDEINLVFESFYRASRTAGDAAGKGLGLTVCKRLIETQGGRIWARNRPGGGLEVGFWLPLDSGSEPER